MTNEKVDLWDVYITQENPFLGEKPTTNAYNFYGTKKDLMTLIGIIHSTLITKCRVSYFINKGQPRYTKDISYYIRGNDPNAHIGYQTMPHPYIDKEETE